MEWISPWDRLLMPQRHQAFGGHGMQLSIFLLENWEISVWQPQGRIFYFVSCLTLTANGWKMQKTLCSAKPPSIGNSWKPRSRMSPRPA